jgi:hypothetical protein
MMTRKALWTILGLSLAVALVVIVPNTRAATWNQATRLTFNQPFEIPGNRALGAGTYWFEVMPEPYLGPNFVQILNADRTKVVATLHTIPAVRLNPTGHSKVTFAEQSRKQPMALINWFYPGTEIGHEFIYSPSKEARLSEAEQITTTVRHAPMGEAG